MTKQLLVTVGTTKFEKLIKNIDNEEFYSLLERNNFTHLIIQKGQGEYSPNKFQGMNLKLFVSVEKILPNFEQIIKMSDYIITHAGAGIIIESLKNKKNAIVCVNDTLMDNHQIELAEALTKDNYVYRIKDITNIVKEVEEIFKEEIKLDTYPDFNYDAIPNVIYNMLGI